MHKHPLVYYILPADEHIHHLIKKSKARSYFYRIYHDGTDQIFFSDHTHKFIQQLYKERPLTECLEAATACEFSEIEVKGFEKRVHSGITAKLHDPPNRRALVEIYLFLKVHPAFSLEYLGRNTSIERTLSSTLDVTAVEQIFVSDIAGRDRLYAWKTHPSEYQLAEPDASERFSYLKAWFNDPDAHIVLSLGSGGLRMYGMPTIFKILDQMGVRDQIGEIWGCSGGAIMGYPYAIGATPKAIEASGYDFYQNRYPEFALKGLRWSLVYEIIKSKILHRDDAGSGIIDVEKTMSKALQDLQSKRDETRKKIPFFSIATRHLDKTVAVLSEPENIQPHMQDMMIGADGIRAAIASASIPIIFSPTEIVDPTGGRHIFIDGMIGEEQPLFYPFMKWQRDKVHKPFETRPKLKIFYVDLRCRTSELQIMHTLQKHLDPHNKVLMTSRIIDLLLDNKINHNIQTLSSLSNVEIIGVPLHLGKLAAIDTDLIPFIIQQSRDHFLTELDKLNLKLKSTAMYVDTQAVVEPTPKIKLDAA